MTPLIRRAARIRRRRHAPGDRSRATLTTVLAGAAVLLLAHGALAQRRGGDAAAAQIENPVAATADSVAAGKRTYIQACESCHGPSGKGDGTAAGADQPSDLSDEVWDFGSSDGEVFSVIRDGVSGKDMRPSSGRLNDTEIWNVVNFVRTLASRQ